MIASSAATVEASQMWAADGDEPGEAQALVAAGRGITLAHDLDVVIEPDQIAVRPLTRPGHARHVQVAFLPGHRSTAIAAAIDALREIGRRRALRA